MGSSEKQVRDAYGEPDLPLPSDKDLHAGVKFVRYAKLGIMYSFVDDKLGQIIATRTH